MLVFVEEQKFKESYYVEKTIIYGDSYLISDDPDAAVVRTVRITRICELWQIDY